MSEECWRANIDEKGRVGSSSRLHLTINKQLLITSLQVYYYCSAAGEQRVVWNLPNKARLLPAEQQDVRTKKALLLVCCDRPVVMVQHFQPTP